MFRRVANLFEGLVAVAFVVTVVLLFTNQPTRTSPGQVAAAVDAYGQPLGTSADGSAIPGPDGAAIFADNCSACHGGDGGGGIGPQLSDGRAERQYPYIADQIAVVSEGRGEMPKFGGTLTPEEIAAVVLYTRTDLANP